MIIKVNQVVFPVSRYTQQMNRLVYGREPFEGYNYSVGDEIDKEIFNYFEDTAKKDQNGKPMIQMFLNEQFNGEKYYLDRCFKNQYFHPCNIQISPTGLSHLTDIEKDRLQIQNLNFIPANFKIYWVNNKPIGHESLLTLPKNISISVNFENFSELVKSFKPIKFT